MANTKAALKDIRQSTERAARNLKTKFQIKKTLKNIHEDLTEKKISQEKIAKAIQLIDRAVAKGRLKQNTAARKKSRLMKKIKAKAQG